MSARIAASQARGFGTYQRISIWSSVAFPSSLMLPNLGEIIQQLDLDDVARLD